MFGRLIILVHVRSFHGIRAFFKICIWSSIRNINLIVIVTIVTKHLLNYYDISGQQPHKVGLSVNNLSYQTRHKKCITKLQDNRSDSTRQVNPTEKRVCRYFLCENFLNYRRTFLPFNVVTNVNFRQP